MSGWKWPWEQIRALSRPGCASSATRPGRWTALPSLMPPARGGRRSAVLVLFAEGPERAGSAVHPTQCGSASARRPTGLPRRGRRRTDDGPVAAALRETAEEVGVDPGDVDVVATLPELFIPPTRFRVVPVLAWWRRPRAARPVDPAEVAAVERITRPRTGRPRLPTDVAQAQRDHAACVPAQGDADLGVDRGDRGPAARPRGMGAASGTPGSWSCESLRSGRFRASKRNVVATVVEVA